MKKKSVWKVLALSCALMMVASSVAMFTAADMEEGIGEGRGKGVISLEAPSFFSIASASEVKGGGGGGGGGSYAGGTAFLEEEAGVSAYVNTSQSIDLSKAESCYRNIEYKCNDYIIGSVELPGLPEDEDVHVYVSADGWIVAYYLKEEPASKIMQWIGYDGCEITTTKLEDAISKMCTCTEVLYQQIKNKIKYYDFKYPDATRLMIIADRIDEPGMDTFEFKIPDEYTFYEASWSHYTYQSYWGSNTKIDGTLVNSFDGTGDWLVKHGYYEVWIEPEVFHNVSIYHAEHYGYRGYACIAAAFAYYEP